MNSDTPISSKKVNSEKSATNLKNESVAKARQESASTLKKETKEVGGPKGPEPTRYGDWESKGRCYDF